MLAPLVAAGCVRCARCGKLIRPDDEWDLGHVDGDPTRYQGPEHARCNRRALTFGGILTGGGLELQPGFVVDGEPAEAEGDIVVQTIGRADRILATTRLVVEDPCTPGRGNDAEVGQVVVGLVPFPRGATGLRVMLEGKLLLERTVPRGKLEAEVTWPTSLSGTPKLGWRASEEGCMAVLGYSNDGGRQWLPLCLPTVSDTVTFDATVLPGGPAVLELRVTDGLRTIAVRSEPYDVEPKGWRLWILAPPDRARVPSGQPVRLVAQACHLEERRASLEGIRWSSSIDGDLGGGASLETVLSDGEHRITAAANDQSEIVTVTIET
jgi:hypothetical protein